MKKQQARGISPQEAGRRHLESQAERASVEKEGAWISQTSKQKGREDRAEFTKVKQNCVKVKLKVGGELLRIEWTL